MIWPMSSFMELVGEANMAPSVHNVQPTLWKMTDNGVDLDVNKSCLVPAADPTSRDIEISLGTAIEGFVMACERRNLAADVEYFGIGQSPVARITITPGTLAEVKPKQDPLAKFVGPRQCFRGNFPKANQEDLEKFIGFFRDSKNVRTIDDQSIIAELADLYDLANLEFYRDIDFLKELNEWLRFSDSHKRYNVDGLNRESMSLDPITSRFAAFVLQPKVFQFLDKLKLTQVLITEAPQIKSSAAVVFFLRDRNEANHLTGRRLYRTWLEFESLGFAVCPISSLTDSSLVRSRLTEILSLPKDKEAILAFRAGPKPEVNFKRARKPINELVVNP